MFTHFNTLLSKFIPRSSQQNSKDLYLNTNSKPNLKHVLCVQLRGEHTELFTKIDHALGYKTSLINFKDSL